VTEQTAIIEATDRSIPPAMTTTAIAAVAKAKGRARARGFRAAHAEARLDQPGHEEQEDEQGEEAERPGMAPHEVAHAAAAPARSP
jgi:hypothetical protein